MIRLKKLLSERFTEAKKLNMDKVEDAAEHLIRKIWIQMPSGDDKFSDHDVFLWLDNDADLSNARIQLAKKFYPSEDEEAALEKFDNVISTKIEELEAQKLKRVASKVNQLDPLFVLKKVIESSRPHQNLPPTLWICQVVRTIGN